jgi:hypothetical protein
MESKSGLYLGKIGKMVTAESHQVSFAHHVNTDLYFKKDDEVNI